MIAIPVKKNQENTAVAPLYGKAKWFALINDQEEITFWRNEHLNGRSVTTHFISQGVDKVAVQNMGVEPFIMLDGLNIDCYSAGSERIMLLDAIAGLKEGKFPKITSENMSRYLEQSHHNQKEKEHRRGHGEGRGYGHHTHSH